MVAQLFAANVMASDAVNEDHAAARQLSDGNVYDSNGDNWGVAWGWFGGSLAGLIVSGIAESTNGRFDSGSAGRNTQYWLGLNALASGITAAVGTWK